MFFGLEMDASLSQLNKTSQLITKSNLLTIRVVVAKLTTVTLNRYILASTRQAIDLRNFVILLIIQTRHFYDSVVFTAH